MIREEVNKNPRLKINKVKMLCDVEHANVDFPLEDYNFATCMIAPPGSGKTNLIINLLCKKGKFYNRKFNRVVFWSPSIHTIGKSIMLPDDQIHSNFDLADLENELKMIEERADISFHTLFVFDDMIKDFKKNVKEFKAMIFNRRHHSLSVIITSQYYYLIPKELRQSFSSIYLFKLGKAELDNIYRDLITVSQETFNTIVKMTFDNKYNFLYIRIPEQKFFKNFNELKIIE